MGKLFGTDGIRGEANRYPMDADTALVIGQTVARVFGRAGDPAKVLIGRDTRASSPMLESAIEAGVASVGGLPRPVGILPTPGVAFLTRSTQAQAGVVISASHNPYQDNGIKIFTDRGFKLTDEQEQEIEDLILRAKPPETTLSLPDSSDARQLLGAEEAYVAFLTDTFPRDLSMKGMQIVLDTANGATCRVAPAVFTGLGAKVTVIHDSPTGRNINENCGSEHTGDLREAVTEAGATLGLAFDGDGDRLVAVDEKGAELTGDQVLIACACMMRQEGRLKNDLVVSTVMSNMGLDVACRRIGLKNHAAKVGDRRVVEDMRKLGAVLGGEESGHTVFLDLHTTGDGVLTGVQLVTAMLRACEPLSELAKLMEVFPQKLVNVEVKSKPDLRSVPEIAEAIAEVEAGLKDEGRVLVRYSGTQSICRVMVEGPSAAVTEKYATQLADVVKRAIG